MLVYLHQQPERIFFEGNAQAEIFQAKPDISHAASSIPATTIYASQMQSRSTNALNLLDLPPSMPFMSALHFSHSMRHDSPFLAATGEGSSSLSASTSEALFTAQTTLKSLIAPTVGMTVTPPATGSRLKKARKTDEAGLEQESSAVSASSAASSSSFFRHEMPGTAASTASDNERSTATRNEPAPKRAKLATNARAEASSSTTAPSSQEAGNSSEDTQTDAHFLSEAGVAESKLSDGLVFELLQLNAEAEVQAADETGQV